MRHLLLLQALALATMDPFAPQSLQREAAGMLPNEPKENTFPPEALEELKSLSGKLKKKRVKELLAKHRHR